MSHKSVLMYMCWILRKKNKNFNFKVRTMEIDVSEAWPAILYNIATCQSQFLYDSQNLCRTSYRWVRWVAHGDADFSLLNSRDKFPANKKKPKRGDWHIWIYYDFMNLTQAEVLLPAIHFHVEIFLRISKHPVWSKKNHQW